MTAGGKNATAAVTVASSAIAVNAQLAQGNDPTLMAVPEVSAGLFAALAVVLYSRTRSAKRALDESRKGGERESP